MQDEMNFSLSNPKAVLIHTDTQPNWQVYMTIMQGYMQTTKYLHVQCRYSDAKLPSVTKSN